MKRQTPTTITISTTTVMETAVQRNYLLQQWSDAVMLGLISIIKTAKFLFGFLRTSPLVRVHYTKRSFGKRCTAT